MSLPIAMRYWPEKMLDDGLVVACRLGMCGRSCTRGSEVVWIPSIRSNWTTDVTHTLPQPEHAGSAVIRYVSLGPTGFRFLRVGRTPWAGLAGGMAGVWGYRTANKIDYIRLSDCPRPVSQRSAASRAGNSFFLLRDTTCPACQFRYN